MSVTIESPRSPRSRKGANWEKYGWMYMRISGAFLVFLIFGHLFTNLWAGEGIKGIDFGFVAGKLANPFWQWYDFFLLTLALIHGTNGMRTIVNDYASRERTRKVLNITLWVVGIGLIVLGTLVIFTFDPCIDPDVLSYLPDANCAA